MLSLSIKGGIGIDKMLDVKQIRTTVFTQEQGFSAKSEFDSIDEHAYHIVGYHKDKPVATIRVFQNQFHSNAYSLGRLAVLKPFRLKYVATNLMRLGEEYIKSTGCKVIRINAQAAIKDIYQRMGYIEIGDEFLYQHVPHIEMIKQI